MLKNKSIRINDNPVQSISQCQGQKGTRNPSDKQVEIKISKQATLKEEFKEKEQKMVEYLEKHSILYYLQDALYQLESSFNNSESTGFNSPPCSFYDSNVPSLSESKKSGSESNLTNDSIYNDTTHPHLRMFMSNYFFSLARGSFQPRQAFAHQKSTPRLISQFIQVFKTLLLKPALLKEPEKTTRGEAGDPSATFVNQSDVFQIAELVCPDVPGNVVDDCLALIQFRVTQDPLLDSESVFAVSEVTEMFQKYLLGHEMMKQAAEYVSEYPFEYLKEADEKPDGEMKEASEDENFQETQRNSLDTLALTGFLASLRKLFDPHFNPEIVNLDYLILNYIHDAIKLENLQEFKKYFIVCLQTLLLHK